jgi:exosortase/archaeosortase family protein
MVPEKGLEPSRPCEHMDLNHACLPIPPLRHLAPAYFTEKSRRKSIFFFSPFIWFVVFETLVAYLLSAICIGQTHTFSDVTFGKKKSEMTDRNEDIDGQQQDADSARENRRRIVRFVTVFVCISLALLISYRYARHTRTNDRYLFEAARSTAWVLDMIGDAGVEPYAYGKQNPQEVRASVDAWLAGEKDVSTEKIAHADRSPLSAWERWSYRALKARLEESDRENGPRVQFILRQGISGRIAVLSGEVNALESDWEISLTEKKERLAPLQAELLELREKQRLMRTGEGGAETDETLSFSFILVPECGAIEIMAIFLAAVIAFPALWRKRFWGILLGTPIMYCVNIFRLTVLAMVGALDQSQGRVWFNFAHEYVWQAEEQKFARTRIT